jgi:hypothetical protein
MRLVLLQKSRMLCTSLHDCLLTIVPGAGLSYMRWQVRWAALAAYLQEHLGQQLCCQPRNMLLYHRRPERLQAVREPQGPATEMGGLLIGKHGPSVNYAAASLSIRDMMLLLVPLPLLLLPIKTHSSTLL